MRRLTLLAAAALAAICILLPASACKRHRHRAAAEQPSGPASLLSMADPRAAVQLTRGFYDPEQGSWRWTAKEFSAVLNPPSTAKEKGAILVFRFSVPEASIQQLKSLTLSAKVDGIAVDPETYTQAGDCVYRRELPPSAFHGGVATVDFLLDKALPPAGSDLRELGVVAQSVGLEAK